MIAHIVRQSIRYPGVVVALALTLVVYGLYAVRGRDLDVFPEFSPSQVVIQTEAPGLSAELVETQVTAAASRTALAGVTGVETIRSQIDSRPVGGDAALPGRLETSTAIARSSASGCRARQPAAAGRRDSRR